MLSWTSALQSPNSWWCQQECQGLGTMLRLFREMAFLCNTQIEMNSFQLGKEWEITVVSFPSVCAAEINIQSIQPLACHLPFYRTSHTIEFNADFKTHKQWFQKLKCYFLSFWIKTVSRTSTQRDLRNGFLMDIVSLQRWTNFYWENLPGSGSKTVILLPIYSSSFSSIHPKTFSEFLASSKMQVRKGELKNEKDK